MRSLTPVKGAIVGFGEVAEKAHLPALSRDPRFSVVAVADEGRSRRESARKLLPKARVYESLEALLKGERSLDFVDIATPPFLHSPQALTALKRRLHVLCEKPLTLDPAAFEGLRAEAARQKRSLFTVHNWKYAPLFQKLHALLREGAVGSVRHLEWHTLRSKPAADASSAKGGWRTDKKLSGGGILVDHGWHAFYLLHWLIGRRHASAVGRLKGPRGGADEEATCLLTYPEATAVVHLTWRSPARAHAGMVYGEAGSIEVGDAHLAVRRGDDPPCRFVFPQPLSHGSAHPEWFGAMLGDFHASLSASAPREENASEAAACVSLLSDLYGTR